MSDDEREPITLLDHIEHAEKLLHNLKSQVIAAGDSEALAASALLENRDHFSGIDGFFSCVGMLGSLAEDTASSIRSELEDFLTENHNTMPRDMFWSHFHGKLKEVEKTSVGFRERCFFTSDSDRRTLFHEVCKLNPPVEVVKTLIDIIPMVEENIGRHFNHLGCTRSDSEYPLHMVARYGGSIELVKLLVDADHERKTVQMSAKSSVYHVLIANRHQHDAEVFSEILCYLVLMTDRRSGSPLLQERRGDIHHRKLPVALLWESLKGDGLSRADILNDNDFTFLLKATCYYYLPQKEGTGNEVYDEIHEHIENISLSRACLICFPCFWKVEAAQMLKDLLSTDSNFLQEKDSWGQYPIHAMLTSRSFFIDTTTVHGAYYYYDDIIISVMKIVPECAQLCNDEGLFPLHIAADVQRTEYLSDWARKRIVRRIWKAYPEAAGIIDKSTGLPPFALAVRGGDEKAKDEEDDDDSSSSCDFDMSLSLCDYGISLSASFFLLRKNPAILSELNVRREEVGSSAADLAAPPAKRQRVVGSAD